LLLKGARVGNGSGCCREAFCVGAPTKIMFRNGAEVSCLAAPVTTGCVAPAGWLRRRKADKNVAGKRSKIARFIATSLPQKFRAKRMLAHCVKRINPKQQRETVLRIEPELTGNSGMNQGI
jgi:hypothetical protein